MCENWVNLKHSCRFPSVVFVVDMGGVARGGWGPMEMKWIEGAGNKGVLGRTDGRNYGMARFDKATIVASNELSCL